MGCTVSRLKAEGAARVCVTSLEESCQTGDLVLFSSRHAASQMTKCFTGSAWDHCGLVVKLSPKHVLILEYAGGVYLYPLFTRLYSYYAIQGREIVIRRLKTKEPRSEMQQQVESFVKSVLGQKPPSVEEMVMAVLKQGPALNAFLSHLRGSKEIEDDLSSLFCSKLVAAVYKHVGLIGPDRTLGDFLPKHFSSQYDSYVDMQNGAKLGPEITISFDAVQAEVDEVKKRVAERERIQPEAVLSLVNSIYLTARESCSDLASSMKTQSSKLHSSTDRELMLKLSSLKGVKLSCLPGNRSDTDLARVSRPPTVAHHVFQVFVWEGHGRRRPRSRLDCEPRVHTIRHDTNQHRAPYRRAIAIETEGFEQADAGRGRDHLWLHRRRCAKRQRRRHLLARGQGQRAKKSAIALRRDNGSS